MQTSRTRTNAVGTVGGRARRKQIETAAAEVLAETGYAATSIGSIAKRIGVSKGVITYHYPSKDELMQQIALNLFTECSKHIAAHTAGASTPAQRLRTQIRAELEFFSTRKVQFVAMVEIMANHRDQDFNHAFANTSAHECSALADLLSKGQAAGQFRKFDTTQVAHLITAAKNDVLDRWATDGSTLDLVSLTDTLLDFIESAVSKHRTLT